MVLSEVVAHLHFANGSITTVHTHTHTHIHTHVHTCHDGASSGNQQRLLRLHLLQDGRHKDDDSDARRHDAQNLECAHRLLQPHRQCTIDRKQMDST